MDKSVATVQYDEQTGDYFIVFDDKLIEQLGWQPGDNIKWTCNEDRTYTLTKEESNEQ